MKYIIIGLGNFGKMLALGLTAQGHEVIGADINETRVEGIKDSIATAFIMDTTEEQSIAALPLKEINVVIVAIGQNFGASIKTVALLKHYKAATIYARADDEIHKSILEAFDIEKILTPEKMAAQELVQTFEFGSNIRTFQLDKEYAVIEFPIPECLVGYMVNKLTLQEEFGLKILAYKQAEKVINGIGISILETSVKNTLETDEKIEKGDHLICYGKYADFKKFWKTIC